MDKYDYTDPVCPSCTEQYRKEPPARRVPLDRILQKLDEHLAKDDSEGGKKMLLYWLKEARLGGDERGELSILNELMGLCRNMGLKKEAFLYADAGVSLAEKTDLSDSVTGATVFLNAATVNKAFGRTDEALDLYRKTREIYEKYLDLCDYRLGSLYNNMGLALFAKKDYAAALVLYEKALEIMKKLPDCEGEQAVTHLNIADLLYATEGAEESEKAVSFRLDEAEKALDGATLRNGKYAFICTKCAPVFGFYGRFLFEAELKKRAKDIYERN